MRLYDIVFGILLTLSIIDIAPAAPVLVQEKRHTSVDAVHVPKHVITVLEKRVDDDLEQLVDEYMAFEESEAHESSSPASPAPDHGSKTDVPAPGPIPASSTVNPAPLMEPPSLSSSTSSMAGGSDNPKLVELAKEFFKIKTLQKPDESSDAHSLSSSAPSGLDHGSNTDVPAPAPNPASSTVNPAPLMGPPRPPRPSLTTLEMAGGKDYFDGLAKQAEEFFKTSRKPVKSTDGHASSSSAPPGLDHGSMNDVPAPPPNPASSAANPDLLMKPASILPNRMPSETQKQYFIWNFLMNFMDQPPLPVRPASLMEFGKTNENQVEHVQHPNPGSSTDTDFDRNDKMGSNNLPPPKRLKQASSKELNDEVVQGSPSPELQ
jgi:hypothetical protein